MSIPDPENPPGAKAPYSASIPVGSPSKYNLSVMLAERNSALTITHLLNRIATSTV